VLCESTDIGAFRVPYLAELAAVHALRGESQLAAGYLAEADELVGSVPAGFRTALALARPFVVSATDGVRAGLGCAQEMAALLHDHHPALAARALHTLVRLGAPDQAAGRLADLAERTGDDLVRLFAADAAASATRDADGLGRISGAFTARGALLLAAESAARAATVLDAAGAGATARSWAVRAAALARRCPDARTPGLIPAERPNLSKRQVEIAKLALDGMSSSEIARRLVLSTRTVENHLQRVYQKIGAGGRGALADMLAPFLDEDGGGAR